MNAFPTNIRNLLLHLICLGFLFCKPNRSKPKLDLNYPLRGYWHRTDCNKRQTKGLLYKPFQIRPRAISQPTRTMESHHLHGMLGRCRPDELQAVTDDRGPCQRLNDTVIVIVLIICFPVSFVISLCVLVFWDNRHPI